MKQFKFLLFLFLVIMCIGSCSEDNDKIVYEDTSDSSITNTYETVEQELIYLTQELDEHRYKKVIDFVNAYFKNRKLKKNNIKLLFLKAVAKEKFADKLNSKRNKWAYRIAEKYKYKIIKNKIYYDFRDYKIIWKRFPKTSYGKDSFEKYFKSLTNNSEKIKSLEYFIESVDKIDYKLKLFDLYLVEFLKSNKYYKKFNDLFYDIKDNENINQDRVRLNFFVSMYIKGKMNFSKLKSKLNNIIEKNNIYSSVVNYLFGEYYLINNNIMKAQKYFGYALNKSLKKHSIPYVLKYSENIINKKQLKNNIIKKIKLTKKILKYNKKFKQSLMKGIISGERVRFRSKPVVSRKNVITTLNYGERVIILNKSAEKEIIGKDKFYWYKVQLMDNTIGWIFGKYITLLTIY